MQNKNMDNQRKTEIAEGLKAFIAETGSANKASKSFKGVSGATISQVLNNNWEQINERMWNSIATQIGMNRQEWTVVETRNVITIRNFLLDAKESSSVHAIIGDASWGKNTGIADFKARNQNVFALNCAEYWTKRYFLGELLRAMGKNSDGSVPEMMELIVKSLNRMRKPLIILNEFDKLKEPIRYFFITICNECEDKAGIVLFATPYLEKLIEKGARLNKKGYQEIYSRLQMRFIELDKPTKSEIYDICHTNGITDEAAIAAIYNDVRDVNCDLRRVKKLVRLNRLAHGQTSLSVN